MNVYNLKLVLSIILIVSGVALAVYMTPSSSADITEGIIIDFGDYETTYEGIDVESYPDALSALQKACVDKGYSLVVEGDTVTSVNSRPLSSESGLWGLYTISLDSSSWTLITESPSDVNIDDYKAVAWALCERGDSPTVALDATGVLFYGYGTAERIVSIAPSCTETICAVGGFDNIVGTDMYSNFPEEVVTAQDNGSISIVGGYTNPSYELILKLNPDIVVCIASQYAHVQMAEKLRESGINVVVTYDGEDMDTIYTNTHMIGVSIGLYEGGTKTTQEMESQIEKISEITATSVYTPRVMMALSSVKSPWIAGSDTYVSDIFTLVKSNNIFDSTVSGWKQVSSEMIAKYNPEYIFVQSEKSATLENYQNMMDDLPSEWKSTDAYKDGNIYMFCDSAVDLSSRPSTRLPQMTEISARIMHPESFDDGIVVSKYIGDDYTDYLTYTKTLNYSEIIYG